MPGQKIKNLRQLLCFLFLFTVSFSFSQNETANPESEEDEAKEYLRQVQERIRKLKEVQNEKEAQLKDLSTEEPIDSMKVQEVNPIIALKADPAKVEGSSITPPQNQEVIKDIVVQQINKQEAQQALYKKQDEQKATEETIKKIQAPSSHEYEEIPQKPSSTPTLNELEITASKTNGTVIIQRVSQEEAERAISSALKSETETKKEEILETPELQDDAGFLNISDKPSSSNTIQKQENVIIERVSQEEAERMLMEEKKLKVVDSSKVKINKTQINN